MNGKSKTGIVTFHNSHNCGSMLQALALQIKIEEFTGTQATIIDFSSEGQADLYSIFPKIHNIKSLVKNLMFIPYYGKLKKQQSDYNKFMKYFRMTAKHYSKNSELFSLNGEFDYWVCGSDQIWNTKCPDADDAYFLNFVNEGKKIAYAPSFGGINLAKVVSDLNVYKAYLDDMDFLSIREFNGKKWLENIVDRNVPVILDPTMLLTKEEWMKYATHGRIIKEDYLFYYAFHYNKEQNDLVMEIAKRKKLKVIAMDVKSWIIRGLVRYDVKLSPEYGPAAFLNLVANSSMVLTRSFHGIAFSVVFEKPFWLLGKIDRHPEGDDRAVSLLTQLDIFERSIVLDELMSGEKNIDEPVNYQKVNQRLNSMRKEARAYLETAFGI